MLPSQDVHSDHGQLAVARGWCIVDYSCKSLPAPHVLRVVRCWGAICDFLGKLDGPCFSHVNAMLRINAMTMPPRDDLQRGGAVCLHSPVTCCRVYRKSR